ncbi:hypothetical protein KP509_24G026500 [Ceratopteris richardii]|nr:hypothetical protein KP509_24G026500 [Ceratopteris richardii]
MEIFSSRVNDGICDCCDGSDEYDGKITCSNTCAKAGKVLRERLEKKISIFKAGLEIRKRDVEHAKVTIAKEKSELSVLKQEEKKLKDQVQGLKVKKEAIEKAEQEEKLQREKEEKARKESETDDASEQASKVEAESEVAVSEDITREVQEAETESAEQSEIEDGTHSDLSKEEVGHLGHSETESAEQSEIEDGSSHSDLSKEELGRLVASRWTGENPNIDQEVEGADEEEHSGHDRSTYDDRDNEHPDEASGEDEDDDDDDEREDADDHNEEDEDSNTVDSTDDVFTDDFHWWGRLKHKLKSISDAIARPFKSPVDTSEADAVRKLFKEATSKLNDLQAKISELEKKLEQDFGKGGEFFSLYGQCYELQMNKYTYKICPFKNAVQMEGRSTTSLGMWDGFKDDYKYMHFARGDRCWNGPDRSLRVKLRCGAKIELRDVDEPSRCEYVAELSTPALCLQERLIVLEQRLHGQVEDRHDEL